MKYNIIASMVVFLFLTACRTDGNLNELLSSGGSAIQKTSKETSTLTDSGKSKIPVSRSRKSVVADLSGTDMAVKAAVKESIDNKGTENTLTSIGGSIDVPKKEISKSTGATSDIGVVKLPESTKSQGISSINDTQGQEKIRQKPATAEEEQMKIEKRKQEERQKQEEERQKQEEERQKQEEERQKQEEERQKQEEERQKQEEEEKQAKDKIEILVKKIDEINRDIDAIKNQSSFVEDVKREIVEATEVIDKITGPVYDHFTDGTDAIYIAWYDLDTDLEELLQKLRNTRGDLRAKLNEGNQRYIGVGNEPKLKENVKVLEIESDLDKLKSKLKEVKEYLKNKSNFEKIKENIVNSDDE
ncbi:hypothetical protein [Borreliella bavariensis]|uniref:Uncharacterized protein n=1 Tax=Borrelia garinii subsp. bavariensis (strain ATCC BAA-2496 / DSM 23469 / PBi) TaxID=290434 RepID=A0A7M4BKU9_BORGP|nr:hypothetical protein [Borreliella bavariensis]AAU85989.1 hypothetical protein BGP138 [Borreliella bavariensis PBi]AZA27239.1 hypothetical protein DB299_05015 [Borreliella bavariensis PBi]